MNSEKKYVGIFDSGLGGLTVAREFIKLMPSENIVFLGDTLHCPYGNNETHEILSLISNNFKFLSRFNLKACIIACNTADGAFSYANDEMYPNFPVYGVIRPTVRKAIETTVNKKVGIWATNYTTYSRAYIKAFESIDNSIKLTSVACPKLVDFIEAGRFNKDDIELLEAINDYLKPIVENDCDTLVLGCTHYPVLTDIIKEIAPSLKLVSSSYCAAENARNNILASNNKEATRKFYVSGDPNQFESNAKLFMSDDFTYDVNIAVLDNKAEIE